MKFVLITIGSPGDVHPLIGLGKELKSRGHEVSAVLQAFVAPIGERAGIRTVAQGNEEEQVKALHNADIWHPKRGDGLIVRWLPDIARESIPLLMEEIKGPETVMIAAPSSFGARILSEVHGVPVISMHLHATTVLSVEKSPLRYAGKEWVLRMPKFVRRMYFSRVTRKLDRHLREPINKLRRDTGVKGPEASGIMRDWWHSPDGVLFAFPEWFAEAASDWPVNSATSRFPLYDDGDRQEINPAVVEFLNAQPGEEGKPVVITPGSANMQAGHFLTEATKALGAMGRRAIVISPRDGDMPAGGLAKGMMWVPYVPFSWLFPRCAAVVHHGGIGTTAFSLAAGVPQLLMPMAHDQPDNAWRLRRWGVGDYLYPKQFLATNIERMLGRLMRSEEVRAQCGRYRELMRTQMTMGEMAEIVEGMGRRGLERRAKMKETAGVG